MDETSGLESCYTTDRLALRKVYYKSTVIWGVSFGLTRLLIVTYNKLFYGHVMHWWIITPTLWTETQQQIYENQIQIKILNINLLSKYYSNCHKIWQYSGIQNLKRNRRKRSMELMKHSKTCPNQLLNLTPLTRKIVTAEWRSIFFFVVKKTFQIYTLYQAETVTPS